MYRPTSFNQIPEVVKNLLIINGMLFLATISLEMRGIYLTKWFALHQFQSEDFMPHQLITHFFMHANFTHLLMNMFALWMFGKILENVWGGKRFLTYYMITGLGAAALHLGVIQFQISFLEAKMGIEQINIVVTDGYSALKNNMNFIDDSMKQLNSLYHTPTVGASGAVFGLLLAFGILFSNTQLRLFTIFLVIMLFTFMETYLNVSIPWPISLLQNHFLTCIIVLMIISRAIPELANILWHTIPIKAKYFVAIYGTLELYLGLSNNPADNVAHFAHLGGMIFGFLLLKYWKKNHTEFY